MGTSQRAAPADARSSRSPYWDNVKCILIFLVVFGHLLLLRNDLPALQLLTVVIYTFHMPAFAFVSGFWSVSSNARRPTSLVPLVVAYVIFNGACMLRAAYVGDNLLLTYPYYALWYLVALSVWRLTVGRVASIKYALPLSVLAAPAAGLWPDVTNAFALGRIIAFYPFFLAGYLMPRAWGSRFANLHPLLRLVAGMVLVTAFVLAATLVCAGMPVTYEQVLMSPYTSLFGLVTRYCIFVIAMLGIIMVLVVAPGRRLPLLTTIGSNSLSVYLLHREVMLALGNTAMATLPPGNFIIASLVATVLLLTLFGNAAVGKAVNGVLDCGAALLTGRLPKEARWARAFRVFAILFVAVVAATPLYAAFSPRGNEAEHSEFPARMSAADEEAFSDSYTIPVCGRSHTMSRSSKEVVGGAVIPTWCESSIAGNYRALPVYDAVNNAELAQSLSTRDLERISEVHSLVTSTMLGVDLSIDLCCERHYVTPGGYRRTSVPQLEVTASMRNGVLHQALARARNVCFVGDSITEGSLNGGFGWYEPIEGLVGGTLTNVSQGSATVRTLLGMTDQMAAAHADLYVVAVGTNDVRYRDAARCAMTADEYVDRLGELVGAVRKQVADARFVFVAPWTSADGDKNSAATFAEKRALNAEYTSALKRFCAAEGHGFVDPNPAIDEVIFTYPQPRYLIDAIHPNSTAGIALYARAALEG